MSEIIEQIQVTGIDHIAVTTAEFKETLDEYLALPGAEIIRGPGFNERQKVNYAFVKNAEGIVIEVLGVTAGSPIENHVKRGGGAYHFCYKVKDINKAVGAILANGGKIIAGPVADAAFGEKPIVFAFHNRLGLFEIVAPQDVTGTGQKSKTAVKKGQIIKNSGFSDRGQIEHELIKVLQRELELTDAAAIKNASLGASAKWDSLGHLRVAMALESHFKVSIDSGDLYKLRNYNDILLFLENNILL